MKKQYYLIEVQQGIEPFVRGPYLTDRKRNNTAKRLRQGQKEDDCLFWADVDGLGKLTVGPYIAGFFLDNR